MTFTTTMRKGHYGHKAETTVSIGIIQHEDCGVVKPAERLIKLSTSKHDSGEIRSVVSVCLELESSTPGIKIQTTAIGIGFGGDFYKTIQRIPAKPVTEKKVKEAHNAALAILPATIEEVKAFYAVKTA